MRAYRFLLRLLPASFRAEYGGEMASVFARRRRDARGPLAVGALWLDAVTDVTSSAFRVHLDLLGQDLRYTARTIRRAPGFTFTVVAVSALGVGATTAAFSITDHVLLRPLPFPEPSRLVQVWQSQVERSFSRVEVSPANFRDWKAMSTSFEATGAFHPRSFNVSGEAEPAKVEGAALTADVLPLLGTKPLIGRVFSAEEDQDGAPGQVVLGHGLWHARFGGDPAVLGRKVILDGSPYEVIGVMPSGFRFPNREAQLWTAFRFGERDFERRDDLYVYVVARLRRGVSFEQAQAEMTLIAAQLERSYPQENAQTGAALVRLRDQVSQQPRMLLLALLGAALCVLLIACTNLAGLLLARGLERRPEIAVRAALGAGRERLVRQLLTEALVLAGAGGLLGVALALGSLPLVARLVPNSLPVAETPPLDWRILGFAALVSVTTAVGFALVPAFRSLKDADASGLREAGRSGNAGGRERLRSTLVAAEVTISVVLLVSSGLLIRALSRVQAVDPGFRTEGVFTLRTSLPMPKYATAARRIPFYTSVLEDVRALPGVTGAAYISFLPMVMGGGIWGIQAPGQPEPAGEQTIASVRYVTPSYFATLGIRLVRGRDVGEADTEASLPVAVVSESFIARYWPGQEPLGRRFRFTLLGSQAPLPSDLFPERTIVGVVADVKVRGVERRSEPQAYLPYRQHPDEVMTFYAPKDLVVKSTIDAAALVPALRRIVARADPELPISDVRSLLAIVEGQTAPRRTQLKVLGGFAALAVVLAALGIHGLLAFAVSSRSREIGVRIALGAEPRKILGLVMGQGARLAAAGAALGLLLAYAAGRALEALLAGVSPRDPATFLVAVAVAVLMTLAGSLAPALRALRVDPLVVMRAE